MELSYPEPEAATMNPSGKTLIVKFENTEKFLRMISFLLKICPRETYNFMEIEDVLIKFRLR